MFYNYTVHKASNSRRSMPTVYNNVYIFLSTCSRTKYRDNARWQSAEPRKWRESSDFCNGFTSMYQAVSINIKNNARFQVLTPVVLRLESSGMQQTFSETFRPWRWKEYSPLKYTELLTLQYSHIPTDLNNHHIKFWHKHNMISSQECPQPLTQDWTSRAILWTQYKCLNNTKLCFMEICC